jgi:hypothetical protein
VPWPDSLILPVSENSVSARLSGMKCRLRTGKRRIYGDSKTFYTTIPPDEKFKMNLFVSLVLRKTDLDSVNLDTIIFIYV